MTYKFTLHSESLKRRFAVYVVLARRNGTFMLYVGKTGDNNDGCNPVISRCGNHFSYNDIHSQVRNKIPDHEEREYTYIFDHFDEYHADIQQRRLAVDRINEMERWLNQAVQDAIAGLRHCTLINPFKAAARVRVDERQKRAAFRTRETRDKIQGIIEEMKKEIGQQGVVADAPEARG